MPTPSIIILRVVVVPTIFHILILLCYIIKSLSFVWREYSYLIKYRLRQQLVGDFTEVWGPKEMVDKDENTCIKSSRQKVDDKVISQTLHFKGGWWVNDDTLSGTLTLFVTGWMNNKPGKNNLFMSFLSIIAPNWKTHWYTVLAFSVTLMTVVVFYLKQNRAYYWLVMSLVTVCLLCSVPTGKAEIFDDYRFGTCKPNLTQPRDNNW